jgi:hypothetical protein
MLPLSQVLKEVTRFHDYKDMYINQNLKWSGEYIRSSISSELLEKLLQDSSISDSGPEAFAALMRVIHSDSYEALETTKKTREEIKLKSYPGENIRKCNEDIGRLAEQLQSGGHFNNELLCKIAQIYEGASDAKFSQWATINLYDKVVQQVKELRVIDKSALDEKLWMCELMIRQSNVKYDAMVVAGRYTSATTQKTDEQTMAHGYIAAMNAAVETLK